MKKKYFILLIIVVLLTSSICYSREINTKLMGKVIVLDVGHGGKDGGTNYGKIFEKDINLSIALKLRDELVKLGADVLMIRDGDYDLSSPNVNRRKKSDFDNRIKYINNSGAELYLSIHVNFLTDKSVYGAQVFYTKSNKVLANVIQSSFNSYLKSPLDEKEMADDVYMYDKLRVPGVLIETGFLSNDKERALLISDDYQEKLVMATVKALINYF